MSEHHYILGTQRSELQFQGTGFTNSCEPLCRYWELNPDLLEKQLASGLTTKLYLQPPSCYYFFFEMEIEFRDLYILGECSTIDNSNPLF